MTEVKEKRQQRVTSIRLPDDEDSILLWNRFVDIVKEDGQDVCRVVYGLAQAYVAQHDAVKEAIKLYPNFQTINLTQHNSFGYTVSTKMRRIPYDNRVFFSSMRKTMMSVVLDAYILYKAEHVLPKPEFTYRDFMEIEHGAFRRIIRRLIQKGSVLRSPLRTYPQCYSLRLNIVLPNTTKKD